MKTTSISKIEEEIRSIQAQLQALGPMHPGSISRQYQVCGRPGCKCKDPNRPQRHGPYNKLDYVYRGKKTCRFIRAGMAQALSERIANYKLFRQLTDRWVELAIKRGMVEFFPAARRSTEKNAPTRRRTKDKPAS